MEKVPRINPASWDKAILMNAERIDHLRKSNVRHPSYNDANALLNHLRAEYDDFAANWYGYIPEDHEGDAAAEACTLWYQAVAIIVLDLVRFYGHSPVPTAQSVYPLLRSKMDDYGYDNIQRFGRDGVIVRLHDKIARLQNLATLRATTVMGKDAHHPNHETVDDTLRDLVGYCLIGCLVEADNWTLPLTPSPLP
jgi:hypothetical protein